jgi:hypothetical protein
VDYEETFALVARYTSIRAVMSLVSFMDGGYIKWM